MAAGNIQKCRLDPAQGRPLGPAAFLHISRRHFGMCMCIFVYLCVYLCIFVYIYVYLYIYIYSDHTGITALHAAVQKEGHLDVVVALLDFGSLSFVVCNVS